MLSTIHEYSSVQHDLYLSKHMLDHVWKTSQQCEETAMYCAGGWVHNDGASRD